MDAREIAHKLGGHFRGGVGSAPCPICQPERRRDQRALSIRDAGGKLLLHCFKSGCSFIEIADTASLPLERAQIDAEATQAHSAKQAEYQAAKLAQARSLWDMGGPIAGTNGESYLRGRGITCELPPSLRWVPDIHHGPSMSWCGAIVADVSSGGVHRTYFDKKGTRVSQSAKMMLGPCAGGAVRLPCTCAADFAAKVIAETNRGDVFTDWETGALWIEARHLTEFGAADRPHS